MKSLIKLFNCHICNTFDLKIFPVPCDTFIFSEIKDPLFIQKVGAPFLENKWSGIKLKDCYFCQTQGMLSLLRKIAAYLTRSVLEPYNGDIPNEMFVD